MPTVDSTRTRPAHDTRLSAVDAAWLHMEDATNLMMVTGIMLFDKPLDVARLRAVVEKRLLAHDRFRQRVVEPRGGVGIPHWHTDEAFDLDAHIHRIALPSPYDATALRELVGDLMSTPLDHSRPLWSLHVVEGVGTGSALICRLHHCIADGIAMVRLFLSITDPVTRVAAKGRSRPHQPEHHEGALGSLLRHGSDALALPWHALEAAVSATDGAVTLGRLTILPNDPQTVLRGPLHTTKRADWTDPIDLEPIKALRTVTGRSVNDVLVSVVTGALRRYLITRGEDPDAADLHAMVPVNLRPLDAPPTLGNEFGLVLLGLPLGEKDPLARLAEVGRRMDELKNSPDAAVSMALLRAMGSVPAAVQRRLTDFFAAKTSLVLTNVPGPRERLALAGSPITASMFWVPQSGHLGLGISIISYAGEVTIGVNTDAHLVPDPERIIGFIAPELDALLAAVRRRGSSNGRAPRHR